MSPTVEGNEPISVTDLTVEAGIGDEIKVAVGIGIQTRYRDAGVQVQIKSIDTSTESGSFWKCK